MIPFLVMDYCFIRNVQDEDLLTVLVGRLYPSRVVFAFPVDMKGHEPVATTKPSELIKAKGLTKFVYRCDQERALGAVSQSAIDDALPLRWCRKLPSALGELLRQCPMTMHALPCRRTALWASPNPMGS